MSTTLLFPALLITAVGGHHIGTSEAVHLTSATMLIMALATGVFYFRSRWLGSGYLCPAICEPAFLAVAIFAVSNGGLSLLFGMTLLAGLFEIVLAFLLRWSHRFISVEVTGVVVTMVGINLIIPDVQSAFHHVSGRVPLEMNELILFLLTLSSVIILSIWAPKKVRLYALVLSASFGYLLGVYLGLFPEEHAKGLADASYFALPSITHFFHFSFDFDYSIPFAIVALSAGVNALGNITTAQKINDPSVTTCELKPVERTLVTNGVMTSLAGCIGAMPVGTSSSNIAYSIPTRCSSRIINLYIAGFFFLLLFLPKVSLLIVYMPAAARSALLAYVICYMIVAGLQIVVSRGMDSRRTLVVGLSIFAGLLVSFLPELFANVPAILKPIFGSSLSTATLVALIVQGIMNIGVPKEAR